uniref:Leucine-rich repeat-containing protein 28-like n=1 Tax=Ciona intestinalis TaxID=7719 RepID=F6Q3Z9_CIOIN|nr:leucine-rich repeat-containing protein 28-like [Ciona intestinalis]XP_026694687.1 leucine-rich repeat-containing protein 28-like [Ciona intestinalis]|eukprot:XP_002128694.1 leucine-rich repeat-containing protein 28-like [Ciona intestinalis]
MDECSCDPQLVEALETSGGSLLMNYQRLETLPGNIFCKIHSKLVRRIFGKCNLIKTISGVLVYVNIVEIYLPSNRMTRLPESICDLQSLESLNLTDNSVEELPSSIGKLNKLNQLILRNNCLKRIPPEIGNLANLCMLDLAHNGLHQVPAQIKGCKSLKHLYLSNNKLATLQRQVCDLETLEDVCVGSNNLLHLPPDLGTNRNLVSVNVSENNFLTAIPWSLKGKHLKYHSSYLTQLTPIAATSTSMQPCYVNSNNDKVYLPNYLNINPGIPALMDLSARAINLSTYKDSLLFDRLPKNVYDIIIDPTGHCNCCKNKLFWSVFVKSVGHADFVSLDGGVTTSLHYLVFCCSSLCLDSFK